MYAMTWLDVISTAMVVLDSRQSTYFSSAHGQHRRIFFLFPGRA